MSLEQADEAIFDATRRHARERRRRRRKQSWWKRATRRPRHFVKKHKALSVLIALMILLLVLLLIFLWILNRKLDEVPRFPIDFGEARPAADAGTTILVVGVDDGKGTRIREAVAADDWPEGTFRSDVLMLVHISSDWSHAEVTSIPRDSYVDLHLPKESADGTTEWSTRKGKINAALSLGGLSGMARTVEQFTDTRIDHVMLTDFDGFAGITEILGGVMVHIPPESLSQPGAQAYFKPGWQLVEGDVALLYVRDRYSLPRGDFDRVQRQQNVIRQIVEKSSSWTVLANPLRVYQLVDEVTQFLAVDDSLTNDKLRQLALDARGLRVSDVDFATIPHEGSATIDGASVVQVVPEDVRAFYDAMEKGELSSYLLEHPEIDRLPGVQNVK